MKVQRVNGIVHGRGCACPVHDPNNDKLKAARKKFLEEKARAAAMPAAPAAPVTLAKSVRRYPTPSDETRRLVALRREGKTWEQAFEIIEAEKQQRGGGS